MDNRPIGIMDSGVGGLTVACVLKERRRHTKCNRITGGNNHFYLFSR